MKILILYYFELSIWIIAFISLAVIDPAISPVFSLCPLHNLGIEYCPGCGLGRAISYLLHGSITESIKTHILGIPAAIILLHRIFSLTKNSFHYYHAQRSHI